MKNLTLQNSVKKSRIKFIKWKWFQESNAKQDIKYNSVNLFFFSTKKGRNSASWVTPLKRIRLDSGSSNTPKKDLFSSGKLRHSLKTRKNESSQCSAQKISFTKQTKL